MKAPSEDIYGISTQEYNVEVDRITDCGDMVARNLTYRNRGVH